MKAQISHKLLSFAALLLMVIAPVAETAQARISAGGGSSNGSSNSIDASSQNTGNTGTTTPNAGNRIPAGGSSTQSGNHINAGGGSYPTANRIAASEAYHDIWTNHINASGYSNGRISAGGNTGTSGNHINAGGNSGGGTYPNAGNRINASGNTGGGTYPNAGNRINAGGNAGGGTYPNSGNRINAGTSGSIGYGCSKVPGGYCYQPGNRINAGGNTGGGTYPGSNRIDASNSGFVGYGCSKVPGGYCYQPGNRIDASSNGSTGGNRIDASSNSNDGNRIDASGSSTPSTGNRIDASGNQNPDHNTCNNLPYPEDIDGHWAEIYVRRLYDLCIVEGYADGKFRPNQPITRAEMLKMGLLGGGIAPNPGCYDNDCGSPFYDLDEWQGPWVRSAYDRGIVEGYSHDRFAPNQHITRAEAVKVVLSTYNIAPLNVSESFFKDVHGWELGWVEKARVIGLVQGIGNGNFDPHRPITRAEAAKIIVKMIEYYDTEI